MSMTRAEAIGMAETQIQECKEIVERSIKNLVKSYELRIKAEALPEE